MPFNTNNSPGLFTKEGKQLEAVGDFKYLGSWINCSEKEIRTWKALTWTACNKIQKMVIQVIPLY